MCTQSDVRTKSTGAYCMNPSFPIETELFRNHWCSWILLIFKLIIVFHLLVRRVPELGTTQLVIFHKATHENGSLSHPLFVNMLSSKLINTCWLLYASLRLQRTYPRSTLVPLVFDLNISIFGHSTLLPMCCASYQTSSMPQLHEQWWDSEW